MKKKLRSPNFWLAAVLIAYLLFTTGFIFEAFKVGDIATTNIPYNPAMSGSRLDLTGNFTPDDEVVRDWLYESDVQTIYADFYGLLFLQETMAMEKDLLFIPNEGEVPQGSYIYLRSYNTTSGKLTFHLGPGMRQQVAVSFDFPIIYQSGNAKVVKVE